MCDRVLQRPTSWAADQRLFASGSTSSHVGYLLAAATCAGLGVYAAAIGVAFASTPRQPPALCGLVAVYYLRPRGVGHGAAARAAQPVASGGAFDTCRQRVKPRPAVPPIGCPASGCPPHSERPNPTILGIGAALPAPRRHQRRPRRAPRHQRRVDRAAHRDPRAALPRRGDTLAELAAAACAAALADAGHRRRRGRPRDRRDDHRPTALTPGLAPAVAARIGAERAGVVDLNAACAGFLYGLDQAAALIEAGRARHVLVCGAEALSRITDHEDRAHRGAVRRRRRRRARRPGRPGPRHRRDSSYGYDDELAETLYAERDERKLRMAGQAGLPPCGRAHDRGGARRARAQRRQRRPTSTTSSPIRRTRGSSRAVADALGVPHEKVSFNVEWTANTSAASIPLALAAAAGDGRLRPRLARRDGRLRRRLRLGRRASHRGRTSPPQPKRSS